MVAHFQSFYFFKLLWRKFRRSVNIGVTLLNLERHRLLTLWLHTSVFFPLHTWVCNVKRYSLNLNKSWNICQYYNWRFQNYDNHCLLSILFLIEKTTRRPDTSMWNFTEYYMLSIKWYTCILIFRNSCEALNPFYSLFLFREEDEINRFY